MTETLYFESIKELRDGYFVEYHPPGADDRFAKASLTFTQETEKAVVSKAMLMELGIWLERYGVPIMMSAWDKRENRILTQDAGDSFLVGWKTSTGKFVHSWHYIDLDGFLEVNQTELDRRAIYKDVPFKTQEQVKLNAAAYAAERRRQNRYLKTILLVWLVVVPTGIALIEYFGPDWLALIALVLSLWQAGKAGYGLWHNSKPSPWEKAKAEKQRRMDHYFNHCERNPEGFARLVSDNFEREAVERTRKEADALSAKLVMEGRRDGKQNTS
ncbi:hypothetical protein [Reyranella sp.]|uniref:hypothetical protein n=1 Tax=Reyranella sp. TaxID=1929291 RepID=UPI001225618D|nr:hypothetical protein [Reyranella sp.]TAJ84092.1 MAG: hypothetical protein EPO50_21240 [Reyranella sp.]